MAIIQLFSTARIPVHTAIASKKRANKSSDDSFLHRHVTHEHCTVFIDGHLQVMRRDKLKKLLKGKDRDSVDAELRHADARYKSLADTAMEIQALVIDRARAAKNARARRKANES